MKYQCIKIITQLHSKVELQIDDTYVSEIRGQFAYCVFVVLRFTSSPSLVHWYRYLQRVPTCDIISQSFPL